MSLISAPRNPNCNALFLGIAESCLKLMKVPLRLINIQLRTVLAVGGVGGLAIGLALQNLVQNLISGILGLFRTPDI